MGTMRCHYDVLNLSKDATDEELKKSYRKLALKWHPDKNPDNVDEAKREFILIQQAFEVLTDPNERAFYDRHRESILKGAGSGYKDESLDIFKYFSSSCYSGYESDENSFYSVYREVFNKLAAEESEYLSEDDTLPPDFGDKESSYEDVRNFYGYWLSFCTKKTYSWLDTYDIRQADNRQIARLMQQENKKVRDKEKKERNEEIRGLVAFVRKRDKRVQAYADYLKKKTEENSRKTEEHRRKMIAKNRKDIELYKESEWSKFSNFENELKEIENVIASEFNDVDRSDDSDIDELFCVACNKSFKTEKAFANHEKSKKHKENVAALKDTMMAEENFINGDDGVDSEEDPVDSLFCELCNKNFKTKKAFENHETSKKHRENVSQKEETSSHVNPSKGDDNSENEDELINGIANKLILNEEDSDANCENLENNELSNKKGCSKTKKQKKKKQNNQTVAVEKVEEIDLSELGGSKKQKKRLEREKILINSDKKLSPRSMRRMKKMLEVPESPLPQPKYMKDPIDFTDLDHRCAYCNQSFVSKNKLFKHLNTTGHSVILSKETNANTSKSSKKKSKVT